VKIVYLLESTELWGGVKVVFEQAEALRARGHEVTIFTKSGPPNWFDLRVPLRRVERFDSASLPNCDFVIATYWSTVREAWECRRGTAIHLCQGYEGDFAALADHRSEIDEVYGLPIPILSIHEPITRLLADRFAKRAVTIGEALDHRIFRPESSSTPPPEEPRILLVGPWEVDWKGIREGLRAIARIKAEEPLWVVRASQFALGAEERRLDTVDEYHLGIPPREMADLYRSATLFVAPSWSAEGFGLPLLEALACGVPSVASDIASFRAFAPGTDFALFTPERDVEAMANAIRRLLHDEGLRAEFRVRGLEVAALHQYDRVVTKMEAALAALRA